MKKILLPVILFLLACNSNPKNNDQQSMEQPGTGTAQPVKNYLTGNGFEPGWAIQISALPGGDFRFSLQVDYGQDSTTGQLKRMQHTAVRELFMGMDADNKTVQVLFEKKPCTKPSGDPAEGTIEVSWQQKTYTGCANHQMMIDGNK